MGKRGCPAPSLLIVTRAPIRAPAGSCSMTNLYDDLRYAVRSLRKAPLFTFVAVLSMGFGIAANTSVFTLVDQVILRTLPVDRPQELVQVTAAGTESYG